MESLPEETFQRAADQGLDLLGRAPEVGLVLLLIVAALWFAPALFKRFKEAFATGQKEDDGAPRGSIDSKLDRLADTLETNRKERREDTQTLFAKIDGVAEKLEAHVTEDRHFQQEYGERIVRLESQQHWDGQSDRRGPRVHAERPEDAKWKGRVG